MLMKRLNKKIILGPKIVNMFISCSSDRINYYTRSDQLFNGKPINQYGVLEKGERS